MKKPENAQSKPWSGLLQDLLVLTNLIIAVALLNGIFKTLPIDALEGHRAHGAIGLLYLTFVGQLPTPMNLIKSFGLLYLIVSILRFDVGAGKKKVFLLAFYWAVALGISNQDIFNFGELRFHFHLIIIFSIYFTLRFITNRPRKIFAAATFAVPVAFAVLFILGHFELKPKDNAPNIIVLAADALRAEALGIYGAKTERMPFISSIANKGVVVSSYYSEANWSRCSIRTFMSSRRFPNYVGQKDDTALLNGEYTLAEALRNSGYKTVFINANPWFDPYGKEEDSVFQHGFEKYIGRSMDPESGAKIWFDEDTTTMMTDDAIQYFEQRDGNHPFFMYVHFMDPHGPYIPPESFLPNKPEYDEAREYYDEQRKNMIDGFPIVYDWEKIEIVRFLYNKEIEFLDMKIRELWSHAEKQTGRPTYLVFMADHGEAMFRNGIVDHTVALYQTLIHIPLVIYGTGKSLRTPENAFVEMVDLAPTLCELAGVEPPESWEGKSAHPLITGKTKTHKTGAISFSEYTGEVSLVNDDGFKAITLFKRKPKLPYERIQLLKLGKKLFNLKEDPEEATNLLESNPEKFEELEKKLWTILGPNHKDALMNIHTDQMPSDTVKMMKSIGYL